MAPSPPRSDASSLGFGLGLRREHFVAATTGGAAIDDIDWFEVITENFLVEGGNPRRVLRAVREHRPIVLHGVSLSIGSIDPLDTAYLDGVRALAHELSPAYISDHLCWTSLGGHNTHDLLPLPYTEEALDHVVARVLRVQEHLGRRILLENPSSYAVFAGATLTEAAFLAELARRADCGLLLDINNVFVSCANHGWSPGAYLDALPTDRIGYVHLAGHTMNGPLIIDTHDMPVRSEVWSLYADAIRRFGPLAMCIERDDNIPSLDELRAELSTARSLARAAVERAS